MNAYKAPTTTSTLSPGDLVPAEFDPDTVTTTDLWAGVIGYTTLAGAVFSGGLIASIGFLSLLIRGDGDGVMGTGMLLGPFFSTPVGATIAFTASLPASIAVLLVVRGTSEQKTRWKTEMIRLFHVGTGALSGWVSGMAVGWFAFGPAMAAVAGIVPAVFGGLFVGWCGQRKLRRLRLRRQTGSVAEDRRLASSERTSESDPLGSE